MGWKEDKSEAKKKALKPKLSRAQVLEQARAFAQANKQEDLKSAVKELISFKEGLTSEETNLFQTAFDTYLENQLKELHAIKAAEQRDKEKGIWARQAQYKKKKTELETQIAKAAEEMLSMVESQILPHTSAKELNVFYSLQKASCLRALAEAGNVIKRKIYTDKAKEAFKKTIEKAQASLPWGVHPYVLELGLKYSDFCAHVLEDKTQASKIAKEYFDNSIAELDTLDEDTYNTTTFLMQQLRDNLTAFTEEEEESKSLDKLEESEASEASESEEDNDDDYGEDEEEGEEEEEEVIKYGKGDKKDKAKDKDKEKEKEKEKEKAHTFTFTSTSTLQRRVSKELAAPKRPQAKGKAAILPADKQKKSEKKKEVKEEKSSSKADLSALDDLLLDLDGMSQALAEPLSSVTRQGMDELDNLMLSLDAEEKEMAPMAPLPSPPAARKALPVEEKSKGRIKEEESKKKSFFNKLSSKLSIPKVASEAAAFYSPPPPPVAAAAAAPPPLPAMAMRLRPIYEAERAEKKKEEAEEEGEEEGGLLGFDDMFSPADDDDESVRAASPPPAVPQQEKVEMGRKSKSKRAVVAKEKKKMFDSSEYMEERKRVPLSAPAPAPVATRVAAAAGPPPPPAIAAREETAGFKYSFKLPRSPAPPTAAAAAPPLARAAAAPAPPRKPAAQPQLQQQQQQQQQQQFQSAPRLEAVRQSVADVKQAMVENVNKVLDRSEQLESLVAMSEELQSSAAAFQKMATSFRRSSNISAAAEGRRAESVPTSSASIFSSFFGGAAAPHYPTAVPTSTASSSLFGAADAPSSDAMTFGMGGGFGFGAATTSSASAYAPVHGAIRPLSSSSASTTAPTRKARWAEVVSLLQNGWCSLDDRLASIIGVSKQSCLDKLAMMGVKSMGLAIYEETLSIFATALALAYLHLAEADWLSSWVNSVVQAKAWLKRRETETRDTMVTLEIGLQDGWLGVARAFLLENSTHEVIRAKSVTSSTDLASFSSSVSSFAYAPPPPQLKTVEEAIQQGVCTFAVTSTNYAPQYWSECRTCGLVDNTGCCESCAKVCHAGHDVINRKWGSAFYCDCGESGNCQCLPK